MANTQYNEEDHNCWVCELHRRVELESLETQVSDVGDAA